MAALSRSVPAWDFPMPFAAAPALRQILFVRPSSALPVQRSRLVAQWRHGADGRLECRWRRAAAPLPPDRGTGPGASLAGGLAGEDFGS